jgi:hypothetical protein
VQLNIDRSGFSWTTVTRFEQLFMEYCSSDNNVLDSTALSDLLAAFGREPHSRIDQKELIAAYHHATSFGPKARKWTIHQISEAQRNAVSFPKDISFSSFLALMELFENELVFDQEEQVHQQTKILKLTEREVTGFRKIFNNWAVAPGVSMCAVNEMPGGLRSPGLFRNKMSLRDLWLFIKEISGGTIDERSRAPLERVLAGVVSKHDQLDWIGFLKVMRWMVDTDYAGISRLETIDADS